MANIDYEEDIISDVEDDWLDDPGPSRYAHAARPPEETPPDDSWRDPRFLVPLLLFLAAVFVIGLAIRANSIADDPSPEDPPSDELVTAVLEATERAGFDGIEVMNDDGLVVLEGVAATNSDAAAIGAVARSVEGVGSVDNRLVIIGGAIEQASSSTITPAAPSRSIADELANVGAITFDVSSSNITLEGLATIESVADLLLASPGTQVEVRGHTDTDGDSAANQRLSQERASAVVAALVAKGVEPSRLTPIGFGESQPIEPNVTEEGRAKNRRIEFVVVN